MRTFAGALTFGIALALASPGAAQPSPLPLPLIPDLTKADELPGVERYLNLQFRQIEAARLAGDCPARDRRLGALQVWIVAIISENTRVGGRFTRSTFEEYLGRLRIAWQRPCPPDPMPPPPPPPPPVAGGNPLIDDLLSLVLGPVPPEVASPPEPDASPPESILDIFEEADGLEGVYIPHRNEERTLPPRKGGPAKPPPPPDPPS